LLGDVRANRRVLGYHHGCFDIYFLLCSLPAGCGGFTPSVATVSASLLAAPGLRIHPPAWRLLPGAFS
jgi:hypothetical protein